MTEKLLKELQRVFFKIEKMEIIEKEKLLQEEDVCCWCGENR